MAFIAVICSGIVATFMAGLLVSELISFQNAKHVTIVNVSQLGILNAYAHHPETTENPINLDFAIALFVFVYVIFGSMHTLSMWLCNGSTASTLVTRGINCLMMMGALAALIYRVGIEFTPAIAHQNIVTQFPAVYILQMVMVLLQLICSLCLLILPPTCLPMTDKQRRDLFAFVSISTMLTVLWTYVLNLCLLAENYYSISWFMSTYTWADDLMGNFWSHIVIATILCLFIIFNLLGPFYIKNLLIFDSK